MSGTSNRIGWKSWDGWGAPYGLSTWASSQYGVLRTSCKSSWDLGFKVAKHFCYILLKKVSKKATCDWKGGRNKLYLLMRGFVNNVWSFLIYQGYPLSTISYIPPMCKIHSFLPRPLKSHPMTTSGLKSMILWLHLVQTDSVSRV